MSSQFQTTILSVIVFLHDYREAVIHNQKEEIITDFLRNNKDLLSHIKQSIIDRDDCNVLDDQIKKAVERFIAQPKTFP